MPFLANLKQKNEENISGEAGVINPNAQGFATPKPVKNSGSWANLDSYLNANKAASSEMGNTIAGNITKQGTNTQKLIEDSRDDFNTMADAGTIANLSGANSDSDRIIGAAKKNNSTNQINDDDVTRYKEVSNAKYTGPSALSASQYYDDAQAGVNKSNEYINNAKSDEGRFNLLGEMFARPTYSQGQKSLDNLLIQGNSDARNNIQTAAGSLSNLQGNFDNEITNAADLAAARVEGSAAAQKYARDNLTSARFTRNAEVDTDLSNIQNQWNNQYNSYRDLLTGYNGGKFSISPTQAKELGLTEGNGQGIFNLLSGDNASDVSYLDLEAFDPNKVVTQDQFAQLAALDTLANQFGANSISKFSNKDDAGTLGLDNNFSASRFGDAANVANTDFNTMAAGTDVAGSGQGSDQYKTNWGINNEETSATANMNANLADYLQNGNFTFNGQGYAVSPTNDISKISNVLQTPLNAISEVFGGTESEEGSQAISQQKADAAAQANFMANLQALLDSQGYDNRVAINNLYQNNTMKK